MSVCKRISVVGVAVFTNFANTQGLGFVRLITMRSQAQIRLTGQIQNLAFGSAACMADAVTSGLDCRLIRHFAI